MNQRIEVGDRIPKASFLTIEAPADKKSCSMAPPKSISSSEIFDGKTVVLFAVPGAFTPTCSERHAPPFVSHLDEIKAKGVDKVACVSTNDIFVLTKWAEALGASGKLLMLSDGNCKFTNDIGMMKDLEQYGMGKRSQRYAMVVRGGIVKYVGVDEGPLGKSTADAILSYLNSHQ